jgi:peptide/nickel transport system permease protein
VTAIITNMDVPPTGVPPAAVGRRKRPVRVPRSPKIIVGLVILGIFVILAVIGPWIAPYSPGAIVQSAT